MKILKFLLIFLFFSFQANAKELPRIDTKFYLGIYKSFDKFSATALSTYHTCCPYYTETDAEKRNLGYFLGYNFYLNNFFIGAETNFQENIGKDQSIAGLNGSVTYEKMKEAKFKIGYNFGDFDHKHNAQMRPVHLWSLLLLCFTILIVLVWWVIWLYKYLKDGKNRKHLTVHFPASILISLFTG